MEWGGGGGGVLPARWCEESGDSEEVYEEGEGMGTDQGDHEDDAESCTGGDEEEEEEEMMGNGKERSSTMDNGWRTWFPDQSCTSSICDEEEENGDQQCVRSVVCVVDEEEHSVHQIQDNRLFWETCLAVGY